MTVKITLFPTRSINESVAIGDIGVVNDVSLFYPLEAQHTEVDNNYDSRKPLPAYPYSRLIVTKDEQTFDNEASWSASVKQQLAILAQKNILIVSKTAADKPGTGDSIAESGIYAELTDAAATFTVADVGRTITIASATTPANNGVFFITGYVSTSKIQYNNTNRVAEAAAGATWNISGWAAQTPTQIRGL